MTSTLLRLYPKAWRQRYGAEMRELLAAEKPSLRTFADLIAGAIDARINPQLQPAVRAGADEGERKMTRVFKCAPAGVTASDQWRSAGWMVGGSLTLTVFGIWLRSTIGPNALSEGLLYSAFPASLMLSSECTYLKRYSSTARLVMAVGGALFVVLITWAAVIVAEKL